MNHLPAPYSLDRCAENGCPHSAKNFPAGSGGCCRPGRRDYAVPQEMGHGPITAPKSFFASVERLCEQIRASGAVPAAKGWDYDGMANRLDEAYRKAALDNRALLADMGTAPAPRHS